MNHPTVARAMNGATVEKEALGSFDNRGIVRLMLRQPDFLTAKSIMAAINKQYPCAAKSIDPGIVQIRVPSQYRLDVPDFIGEVGLIGVMPDTPAHIVINEPLARWSWDTTCGFRPWPLPTAIW